VLYAFDQQKFVATFAVAAAPAPAAPENTTVSKQKEYKEWQHL
jgi:hypothetical protein